MTDRNTKLGWHWLPADRHLRYGDDRRTLGTFDMCHVPGKPDLCRSGLHWSPRIINALDYATGPILCRVECWGKTVHGSDKAASEYRQIRWWIDAEVVLWTWLCDTAEGALEVAGVADERSLAAIALRREWLLGRAVTDQEWNAARAAARNAARAAAWNAARAAARNAARAAARAAAQAAAWAAARAAAWNAAWAAARAAARAAAWNAAWNAARDAARNAAWDAAWDASNEHLTALVHKEALRLNIAEWDR